MDKVKFLVVDVLKFVDLFWNNCLKLIIDCFYFINLFFVFILFKEYWCISEGI